MDPQLPQVVETWTRSDTLAALAIAISIVGSAGSAAYTLFSNWRAGIRETAKEQAEERVDNYNGLVSDPLNAQIAPLSAILQSFPAAHIQTTPADRNEYLCRAIKDLENWFYDLNAFCVNNGHSVIKKCGDLAESMWEEIDTKAKAMTSPSTQPAASEKYLNDIRKAGEKFRSDIRELILKGRRMAKEGVADKE